MGLLDSFMACLGYLPKESIELDDDASEVSFEERPCDKSIYQAAIDPCSRRPGPPPPPPCPRPHLYHATATMCLDIAWKGPWICEKGIPYVYLTFSQTQCLEFPEPKSAYWEASIVLAEACAQLAAHGTEASETLSEIQTRVVGAISDFRAQREDIPGMFFNNLEMLGELKQLDAILLNGKRCEVKVLGREAMRGIWYYTWQRSAIRLDSDGTGPIGSSSSAGKWEIVPLHPLAQTDSRYYIKELTGKEDDVKPDALL